jgi:hypothetical protein
VDSLLSSCTLFCSEGAHAIQKIGSFIEVDYSFEGASYFSVVFAGPFTLPESFLLSTEISGHGTATNLEIKCVLSDETTVWWYIIRDFRYGNSATQLNIGRGHFTFAWGDAVVPFHEVRRIEVTLTGGLGHKGTIRVDPIMVTTCAVPVAQAAVKSIATPKGVIDFTFLDVEQAIELDWKVDMPSDSLEVRFYEYALLGGIVLYWAQDQIPECYELQWLRSDGSWVVGDVVEKGGFRTYHRWPFGEAAGLRFQIRKTQPGKPSILQRLDLKSPKFGKSWNALYEDRAAQSPRGVYPRAFLGEQSYWTVFGVKGGHRKGLINEEGQVELGYNLPSIEPFIRIKRAEKDSGLLSWDGCTYTHELVDEYLPLPVVTRRYKEIQLTVRAWADFVDGKEHLFTDYQVTNLLAEPMRCELLIAMRPFLVNPQWQDLNVRGGFNPIWELGVELGRMRFRVDEGVFTLESEQGASEFFLSTYWSGDVIADDCCSSDSCSVTDTLGHCSGVLRYSEMYGANESRKFGFRLSFGEVAAPLTRQFLDDSFQRTRNNWHELLNQFSLDINAVAQVGRTFKAQVGYIFTNLFGPWIQPGTRCYRRSWIRDGSLTSSALLRCGYHNEVRAFIEAYVTYVGKNGAVPCVVDGRGADHTPEYDSQGEFLFLLAEYYRFTGDRQLVETHWSQVRAVVSEIARLSDLTMGQEVGEHCRGLLPPSISHEGYSNKAAFSFWDDFWGVKGLRDALFLVKELGSSQEVQWFSDAYETFKSRVLDCLRKSIMKHGIDYIPGAADLGDFDPCSTTIGVDPCEVFEAQDRSILEATFCQYWDFFEGRSKIFGGTDSYTPYEWRVVGTLSRLQMNQQAQAALKFFLSHSRPAGWCHWGEVIWGDQRMPRFIGDAPHGWVGSDYLRSIYSLLIRWEGDEVFFGEGVPEEWWRAGFSLKLRIPQGWLLARCITVKESGYFDLELTVDATLGGPVPVIVLTVPATTTISWRVFGAGSRLVQTILG